MKKLKWFAVLKPLFRIAMFSFGTAVGLTMIVSVGLIVLTGGEHVGGPSEGRTIFHVAFAISLIGYVVAAVLRGKSDSAENGRDTDAGLR
ncbi:MAG: hypothetical protein FWF20_11925 [Betaproteobacteria bacterium]|nr:hypothetical protein [Betaproteobacteria bacterium]MCL2887455.1 hypothetical protein [Betaproteobacteria bacterium]